MTYTKKRSPDLLEDLDILLGNLCVKGGFCNRLNPKNLIVQGEVLYAEDFAITIIAVEGLDPTRELDHLKWIKREFTERYGNSVSLETYLVEQIYD